MTLSHWLSVIHKYIINMNFILLNEIFMRTCLECRLLMSEMDEFGFLLISQVKQLLLASIQMRTAVRLKANEKSLMYKEMFVFRSIPKML